MGQQTTGTQFRALTMLETPYSKFDPESDVSRYLYGALVPPVKDLYLNGVTVHFQETTLDTGEKATIIGIPDQLVSRVGSSEEVSSRMVAYGHAIAAAASGKFEQYVKANLTLSNAGARLTPLPTA